MGSWTSEEMYPGTWVASSESGWMNSEIFYQWFSDFCAKIDQRPILLIFDGHKSHITYNLIRKARAEQVHLLKLPPHTTDRLQPLDVVCFRPLKVRWDKELSAWNTQHHGAKIPKREFIELVG